MELFQRVRVSVSTSLNTQIFPTKVKLCIRHVTPEEMAKTLFLPGGTVRVGGRKCELDSVRRSRAAQICEIRSAGQWRVRVGRCIMWDSGLHYNYDQLHKQRLGPRLDQSLLWGASP